MSQLLKHKKYLPGYNHVAHHKWRTVQNSAAYLLPKLQSLRKENPTLSLLDVGAGSGTISVGFAKLIGPYGQVTATDLSGVILRQAAEFASAAGVENVTFREADAYALPFPDATFDVTHCHQMLCHMDAPSDALREMLRVTKPGGGVVAAREADMATQCVWPELGGMQRFYEVNRAVFLATGGCWTGGRRLVSWALGAGARRDQITASYGAWCYSAPEDRKVMANSMADRIRYGEMRKKGSELGVITDKDQVEEMAMAWLEWAERDDASMGIINGEIIIQK